MSYILDALKISEQTRQLGDGAPRYSLLPVVDCEISQRHAWPYALAAGLVINASVLFVWLQPGLSLGRQGTDLPRTSFPAGAANGKDATVVPNAGGEVSRALSPAPRDALQSEAPPTPAVAPGVSRSAGAREAPASVTNAKQATAVLGAGGDASPAMTRAGREVLSLSPLPTPAIAPTASLPAAPREESAKLAAKNVPGDGVPVRPQTPDAAGKPVSGPVAAALATSAPVEKTTQRKDAAGVPLLPAAARPELPAVSVSGFIHEDGSNGMAIVNDKLVREGDEITPGLTLEKILGDSVVLSYKGQRFTR